MRVIITSPHTPEQANARLTPSRASLAARARRDQHALGRRGPDGTFTAGHHLSFDQFDQDQIVVLNYGDDNGRRQVGLSFLDRADVNIFDLVRERDSIMRLPEGPERTAALERWRGPRNGVPLAAERVYLGRSLQRAAVLTLSDPNGRARLRLMVDSLGAPRLEFLDADGQVIQRLPGSER